MEVAINCSSLLCDFVHARLEVVRCPTRWSVTVPASGAKKPEQFRMELIKHLCFGM